MSSGSYGSAAGSGRPTEPYGQQPPQPPAGPGSPGGPPPGGPRHAQPEDGARSQGQSPYWAPPQGQPAYQAPQQPYGAPPPPGQYGDQAGGPQYAQPQFALPYQPYAGYGPSARPAPRPGITGVVLALLAAVAGIIAFTATHWFSGKGDSSFSKVHDAIKQIDRAHAANGLSLQYFSWLAWVLLAAGVVAAIAGNLPSPASGALRAVGALVGVAGIVITLFSVKFISKDSVARAVGAPHGFGGFLKDAAKAPSLYLALGAFLFVLVASLLGPRRATT